MVSKRCLNSRACRCPSHAGQGRVNPFSELVSVCVAMKDMNVTQSYASTDAQKMVCCSNSGSSRSVGIQAPRLKPRPWLIESGRGSPGHEAVEKFPDGAVATGLLSDTGDGVPDFGIRILGRHREAGDPERW